MGGELEIEGRAFGQRGVAPSKFSFIPSRCARGDGLDDDNVCQHCSPGWFSNVTAAQSCTACPPGKFQNASKQRGCIEVPAGSFQPMVGSNYSMPCPRGTYAPEPGAVFCT